MWILRQGKRAVCCRTSAEPAVGGQRVHAVGLPHECMQGVSHILLLSAAEACEEPCELEVQLNLKKGHPGLAVGRLGVSKHLPDLLLDIG
eukprot:scaffold27360_cov53-Prasinocladus_malaysianus.AAC.4